MRLLRAHHITNLVEVVDSFFPRELPDPRGGRPLKLHQNEVIALLIFSSLAAPQRTLTGIYQYAQVHYYRKFRLPAYSTWMKKCNQALPNMCYMLDQLLVKDAPLRFMDSTMLQVCKLVRANRHKVAKEVGETSATTGKVVTTALSSIQRLILEVNSGAIHFTPANEHDAQQIPYLVNDATRIAVGDGGYTAASEILDTTRT